MIRSLNSIGVILALTGGVFTAGVANAQNYGENRAHRQESEVQRVQAYASEALRNNQKDCGVLYNAHEERGQVIAECMSSSTMRELTYAIKPAKGKNGERIVLVSNAHNREMPWTDGSYLDRR